MNTNKLINLILAPQIIKCDYKGPLVCSTITVVTPDMTGCHYVVSGDWGPMYRVTLDNDRPFLITLETGSEIEKATIHVKYLAIESPHSAEERMSNPLFMKIPWVAKNLYLNLSFSASGIVDSIQLKPKNRERFWEKVLLNV